MAPRFTHPDTGTPTAAGSSTFTVVVTDARAATTTQSLTITISTGALEVTTISLPNGSQSSAYSSTLTAVGGTTPYSWSLIAGALPAGLSLDATSGVISGTPTVEGSSHFTVQVIDTAGNSAMAPLTVTISFTNGYGYERVIVIDHIKVPNTDQQDFLVLIAGIYPYLATTANGGYVQNGNGYDIVFTSDDAGQLQLDHEIDSYDPLSGTVAFWVRIPLLSHTSDTMIYLWAGNSYVTTSQENKAGVWRNGYVQVWHKGGLETTDSLGTTGNPTGITAVAGQIDGAGEYNGSSANTLNGYGSYNVPITVSAWVKRGSLSGDEIIYRDWLSYYTSPGSNYWGFDLRFLGSTNQLQWMAGHGGSDDTIVSTTPLTNSSSFHYVVGLNNTTQNKLYIDGTPAAATTVSSPIMFCCTLSQFTNQLGESYTGILDEVRVSTVERSADWVATEYNNQSSPATLFSVSTKIPPAITTIWLSSGMQYVAYNSTLTATGGLPPFSWSIVAGALPAGLTLNPNTGILSGTPMVPGAFNFTVQLQDANSLTTTQPLALTINSLLIATSSLPAGTQDTNYSTMSQAGGGVPPYLWSILSGSLPAGLSLDPATGVISGLAASAGTFNLTVQVLDSNPTTNGTVATQNLTLTVNVPVAITTGSLPDASEYSSYSATLAVTGGTAPYQWSITSGSLPDGLSLNSSSGAITGMAASTGTSTFTVQVIDANTSAATQILNITSELWSRVVQISDSMGNQTAYTGELIGGDWYITDVDGTGCDSCNVRGQTHRTFDGIGNILTTTDALSHTVTFTYDGASNMASQSAPVDANDTATCFPSVRRHRTAIPRRVSRNLLTTRSVS